MMVQLLLDFESFLDDDGDNDGGGSHNDDLEVGLFFNFVA